LTATNENLGLAFDFIDEDHDGLISIEEIQGRLGDNIPRPTYEEMLKEFVKNTDGEVDIWVM
jgi:Ca2+-binding EF-hand superfamily protein